MGPERAGSGRSIAPACAKSGRLPMSESGTLIVTGASRGIGAATALLAARQGYAVCVNYLQRGDQAQAVVTAIREAGGAALALQADVSDEVAVQAMFDQ